MNYKLCILAAGIGKRMRPLTVSINKALLPLGEKAAISHVIEKHEDDVEIVIAISYEKEKLIEYLLSAYPTRRIKFVEVDKITEEGSGPGYSLLLCRKYLQTPFVLTTIDTIVEERCPLPNNNWMGIDYVKSPKEYCTVIEDDKSGKIIDIFDKISGPSNLAFIGLAGIKDYELFFSSLLKNPMIFNGELQVSNGFNGLIKKGLFTKRFTWYDVGNIEGYRNTISKFSGENNFDFSKVGENIYFINDKVIKYFDNSLIVKNRIKRADFLKGLVPEIIDRGRFFYSYSKVPGKVIYDLNSTKNIHKLFDWLKTNLWIKKNLNNELLLEFKSACKDFYYKKTIDRIRLYHERFKITDGISKINNKEISSVKDLLEKIDFDWLSDGYATGFHGDLQFDNIIYSSSGKFKLIDWRQDFSGIVEYGDMYYDLAKLNGGCYISYKKIKSGSFDFSFKKDELVIEIQNDNFLIESKKILNDFIINNNLNYKKIEILTGLIFLNMSPMHNEPFSHYVYNMGKYHLNKFL